MTKLNKDGQIYLQHESAFSQVSAYVVMKGAERVATIAIKYPPKGHGERRLWAYVHAIGLPMVRGHAYGYGYDKRSAAILSACDRLPSFPDGSEERANWPELCDTIDALKALKDSGRNPEDQLRDMGYSVFQAV